jgi:GNAT superfamily N-acetyltransferase
MSAPSIRAAVSADADAIARLLDQLGYPALAADIPARLAQIAEHGRAAVFVAEQDGRPVGLATSHIITPINHPHDVAWLTSLVIDESVRGTGVGRALVSAVEEFARSMGCERLSVTTAEHRAGAQAFYPRLGFEYTGRRYGKRL